MKEAIGHVPLYTFIMTFIIVMFAFLSATLMYYKAFKVNSKIAYALEEFEGLNSLSDQEIDRILSGLGYHQGFAFECKKRNGMTLKKIADPNSSINKYPICIYYSGITSNLNNGRVGTKYGYFNYGITTHIFFDVPIINQTIKIPIYSESERIFKFDDFDKDAYGDEE